MDYKDFISSKQLIDYGTGFEPSTCNHMMFEFQKAVASWACKRGRAAMFEGCGMGKTIQSLEWATQVSRETQGDILILAPLAVSRQTQLEGAKFGYDVNICNSDDDIKNGINITNYEKLHNFDPSLFAGVVADESSIMKSFSGKIKKQMCDMWANTKYRLSCTATPSPNDFEELGNQAEFLGICSRSEMLSMFFINDTANVGTWRLKKHATDKFWSWVCSWAVMIQKPSDIGYDDEGYILPELNYHSHTIKATEATPGRLWAVEAKTMTERRQARKGSLQERCELAADLVNNSDVQWVVWCGLNDESKLMAELIPDAIEVTGSDSDEHKAQTMLDFAAGKIRVIVSKVKIAGFGMNWQSCHKQVFVGLSDSFEALYQAVRRCYRFGQKNNVDIHIVTHETEGAVVRNIQRKEKQFDEMQDNMVKYMQDITKSNLIESPFNKLEYKTEKEVILPEWLFSNMEN